MASRGLPGFLRRSIRTVDYEEEEEAQDEEESSSVRDEEANTKINESEEEEEEEEDGEKDTVLEPQGSARTEQRGAGSSRIDSSTSEQNGSANEDHDHSSNSGSTQTDSWQEVSPAVPEAAPLPQKSYRESQFEKVLQADVVNMTELRKLAWNGIPFSYRAQVWKILLGYLPTNAARREQALQRKRSEYRDAMAQHYDIDDEDSRTLQEQETLRQVLVDVPRTQPDVPLFRNDRIKRVLSRLLYIWAIRHPASSYVQGINDLATPLLAVFLADYFEGSPPDVVLDGHVMNHFSDERLDELEADVYWCMTNLLAGIQDHYTADQPGVQRMVARLEELVHRIDSDLTRHIRDESGIQFLQFSFKWMNCLLLREFQLKCVFRLWDTYLSEKDGFEDFHVYVCAAFMCQFSAQLQEMAFDEIFVFMQEMPTADWTDDQIEVLLSQAYVLSTLFKGSDAHLTSNNGMT